MVDGYWTYFIAPGYMPLLGNAGAALLARDTLEVVKLEALEGFDKAKYVWTAAS